MHNCKEFDAMANAVLTESIEAQDQVVDAVDKAAPVIATW